ncbi:hypothetical protein niasHS_006904 [Heterodera schachtii]|uniref:Aminopeptidase n=1 Tax=Heterodera schachtii TaxID=97005 RepID=A0ABD2JFX3_HETSC
MSQKRANTLPLVVILCLALIMIGATALFIWLKSSGEEKDAPTMAFERREKVPTEDGGMAQIGQETTTAGRRTTDADRTEMTTRQGTDAARGAEGTSTVGSTRAETETVEEQVGNSHIQPAHAPMCEEWTTRRSDECAAEEGSIASPVKHGEEEVGTETDPLDWLRPFEYSLNLSLSSDDVQQPSFSMDMQLSILVELNRDTSVIPLHCGSEVDIVGEVRIWSCSAEAFVCVRSMTRLPASSLLLLHLSRPLSASSLLRVQFPLVRVSLTAPNDALFVHVPSRWERHRPWMIGSQFALAGGVRKLFPSIDSPHARAVLRLCLTHTKQTIARSNAPLAFLRDGSLSSSVSSSVSCFRHSPSLPPAQFAFLLFRNLRPVTSLPSSPAISSSQPHIELFIGAHLNPSDYEWAIEESRKTIGRMGRMTGIEYPLEKLTLVSSPLQTGNDAIGALGLAQIRDSWMEYPKFVHTHELLIGQLIRQWTSNVLSLCDQCLQNGFGLYLEWLVGSEQLGVETNAEFDRRLGEARDRLMEGNTKTEGPKECAERMAVVLHMLERTFGAQNITNFVSLLFRRYGWTPRCTSTAELSKLFTTTVGMPEAQRVFDSFLRPSVPSPSQIPLVHISVRPSLSLLRFSQFSSPNVSSLLSIPVEIVDDTLKSVRLVLNTSQLDVPFVASSFAVAQPKSTFARFVYNAENYAKLAKCISKGQKQSDECPAISESMLKNVWDDLCCPTTDEKAPTADVSVQSDDWLSLFRVLTTRGAVNGDCACCMKTEEEAMGGPCRWTWLDRCARVAMPKK